MSVRTHVLEVTSGDSRNISVEYIKKNPKDTVSLLVCQIVIVTAIIIIIIIIIIIVVGLFCLQRKHLAL